MASIYDDVSISDNPLETLKRCKGHYVCPKDNSGKRLGPLVGLAGTYTVGGEKKHFVSDEYFNFAMTETYPHVCDDFARRLAVLIQAKGLEFDCVLGAPMGGIWIAGDLARVMGKRRIFAEKRSAGLANASKRGESRLVLDRHNIKRGDRILICEDVCNNFSTSEKLIGLVIQQNAKVVGIVCEMNRSSFRRYSSAGGILPLISLIEMPIKQYKQEDPKVAHDVAIRNVIWSPKDEWNTELLRYIP